MLSFFSSRRNWDSPNPSSAGEYAPPPFGTGKRGTLAGERGGGRVPIATRGHTMWYSVDTYFGPAILSRTVLKNIGFSLKVGKSFRIHQNLSLILAFY